MASKQLSVLLLTGNPLLPDREVLLPVCGTWKQVPVRGAICVRYDQQGVQLQLMGDASEWYVPFDAELQSILSTSLLSSPNSDPLVVTMMCEAPLQGVRYIRARVRPS